MSLAIGSRLGAYEVTGPLGAGGMGAVYRARDTRLKRDVALKILPDSVCGDPDRLARFQREAEMLASLNHPQIAAIYGVEEGLAGAGANVRALVMELVEGRTLADRIADGPLPVDEALAIARQIADALEAAHDRGIIHRDLKPANIVVRDDGGVKVLDFGLAKAVQPAAGGGAVSMSPTLSIHATQAGLILGTAAYMSPEQARGKPVDERADIWAFGCVLFEMLSARRAFEAEDVSLTLAEVMKGEPDFSALPAEIPAHVRQALRLCLQKSPARRIADIRDVRLALDGAFETQVTAHAGPVAARPLWRRAWPVVAASLLTAALAGAVMWSRAPLAEPMVISRFVHTLPGEQAFRNTGRSIVAISPDGRRFAYNASGGLYLRQLSELDARLIAGTEMPLTNPAFSPDGESLVYLQAGELKRISIHGGTPVVLCPAENPFGISWERDNTILFGQPKGIFRVSGNGGTPAMIVEAAPGEALHVSQLLPDGETVLFSTTTSTGAARWDQANVVAQSLRDGRRTVLVRGASDARYLPSGHLAYAVGDALFAVRFDAAALRVDGGPVPVLERIFRSTNPQGGTPAANYGVSANGTLVYASSGATDLGQLVQVDRAGVARPISERFAAYRSPRIAPDGVRIAVDMLDTDGSADIWIIDAVRGTHTRLTTSAAVETVPLWTRDGMRIVFSSNEAGGSNALYWISADGTGAATALTTATSNQGATSFLPDGGTLVFYEVGTGEGDLFTVKPGEEPVRLTKTPFVERGPAFSPDGHWLAYSSNETGRHEVYVTRYPESGGKIMISTAGGRSPRWSANGRELFFRDGRRMMVVALEPGAIFRAGTPRVLFEGSYQQELEVLGAHNYDVSPDGQRFVMIAPQAGGTRPEDRPQIVVVGNWLSELRRLVP